MYAFDWETPVLGGRLKSPHALDVPFTFDTIDLTNATDRSAAAHKLAATMSGDLGGLSQRRDAQAAAALAGYDAPHDGLDADCR